MGNSRVSYTEGTNGNAQVVEENSYYALGLQHKGYGPTATGLGNAHAEQYKYQGQERQDELGLNWDSFKWRNYDYTIGRFMSVDPLAEKYQYNSVYAFQENKLGLGRELEGLELQLHDYLTTYLSAKFVMWKSNVNEAQRNLKGAIVNRVTASAKGETDKKQVAGVNVNKAEDLGVISQSVSKIEKETKKAVKQVVRDGADTLENSGDAMVVAAPLTGPAAPVVAATGETLSTVGTATNITMDAVEGDYEGVAKRITKEIITGGLSTAVKNAPGVNEQTSQIVNAHIEVYDNVIIPKIQEKLKTKE